MRNPVRGLVAAGLLLTAAVTSSFNSARAEDCPGNPDALGTSRVLTSRRCYGPCGGATAL